MEWLWLVVGGLGFISVLFFTRQLRRFFCFLRNGIIGCIGLIACNVALAPMGLAVGVNFMTFFIVGILGLPGFMLLYIAQSILQ